MLVDKVKPVEEPISKPERKSRYINIQNPFLKELAYLGMCFILLFLLLKIVFYREGAFLLFKLLASLFYLILIPGFLITYYWRRSLNFLTRAILGCVIGTALFGLMSYYASVLGIKILYQWTIPLIIIVFGVLINWKNIQMR